MASFSSGNNNAPVQNITSRNVSAAKKGASSVNKSKQWWSGYLRPTTKDPRNLYPTYGSSLSRFGKWWQGYDKAYDTMLTGTKNYRDDWNTVFDDNEQYLDTNDIQDTWRDYRDRIAGYYGDAKDAQGQMLAGFDQDFIDRDAYDLWGNLATGNNQAQNVQDWFSQSTMGQYLEDQANENFWRQAQLGGKTYNPQEVNEFISNQIVAPEAQQAFGNLAQYASLQPELSWQVTNKYDELERWYADAVAQGDTYAQQNISQLMNQMQQQMYQHNMTQGMGDAQLRYLIEAQMPATRTMDYTQQKLAHSDMAALMKLAGGNRENRFDFLANTAFPNAYDNHLWQSGMYDAALKNQESALNAQIMGQLASAGIGAVGSIAGAI